MTQPTRLDKYRKAKRKEQARGKTLCKSGRHKWVWDQKKQFDVREGKLVSIKRCNRCGAQETVVG
jgi:hypothetical protein